MGRVRLRFRLETVAVVSGLYDLGLALPMLLAPVAVARLFGAPDPVPVLNAQLNGVFALALGIGYFWAARDTGARRGYFWVAGVLAKGLGASLFMVDHMVHGSPGSFLLFAAIDGLLAVVTAVALLQGRSRA
jgi:hypothetical protein